jgi:anti-sigma factor ChrR (cupin superfamily)
VADPDGLTWEPLRPGVDKHLLYELPDGGPAAALLRYQPGAEVPHHEHPGFEHIVVLAGAQHDERGRHAAGSLVVNPPGSAHRVWSPDGCLVLIVWERPVRFVDP